MFIFGGCSFIIIIIIIIFICDLLSVGDPLSSIACYHTQTRCSQTSTWSVEQIYMTFLEITFSHKSTFSFWFSFTFLLISFDRSIIASCFSIKIGNWMLLVAHTYSSLLLIRFLSSLRNDLDWLLSENSNMHLKSSSIPVEIPSWHGQWVTMISWFLGGLLWSNWSSDILGEFFF